jgi:hypothetical protein
MNYDEATRIRRLANDYAQASYEEGVELGHNGANSPAFQRTRTRTLALGQALEDALRVMSA